MSRPSKQNRLSAKRLWGECSRRLIPALVFLILAGLGAAYALLDDRTRVTRIETETSIIADQVGHRLESWIDARISMLAEIADEMSLDAELDVEAYRRAVLRHTRRTLGFQAINWVDAQRRIQVISPVEGNEQALGKQLDQHPEADVRRAIELAAQTRDAVRSTSLIEFYQGGKGFTVYWPVERADGSLKGFVNGVFRVQELVDQCLSEAPLRDRFRYSLSEADGSRAYVRGTGDEADWKHVAHCQVDILDLPWLLHLAPTPAYLTARAGIAWWQYAAAILIVAGPMAWLLWGLLVRQARLQESEGQVRLLMDSTAEGIFGLGTDGSCTFCNTACLQLLGYERPEDLLGKNMHVLMHHSSEDGRPLSELDCNICRALIDAESIRVDTEFLWRKDGTSFPAEYTSVPMRDGGEIIGAVVTFTDVTRRRLAEGMRNRLAAILEATPDMIGMADANGRPLYISPNGRKLLGLGPDTPLETSMLAYHPSTMHERLLEEAVPTAGSAGVWHGESALLDADGKVVPVSQVLLGHFAAGGRVEYYSTIIRDISGIKQSERERQILEIQFQQAQKMESLGLLAGGIAHDFNNLLVGILGNLNHVADELQEGSHGAQALQSIGASAELASDLVRQLLAYSGKGHFVVEALDLRALVSDTLELLKAAIPKRVEVRVEAADEELLVQGDPTQIRQVLMNLVTNAADAIGDENGSVVIRLRRTTSEVAVTAGQPSGSGSQQVCAIEVEDSGCGMTAVTRARIFDPFFTTKESGRGLGLSAVMGIVRGHGGSLSLSTEPGRGTRFEVLLPCTDARPAEPGVEPEDTWRGSGRVLVIDDEAIIREVVGRSLESAGFEVILAESGEEGLAAFEREHADLSCVLLDLTMPGMSGKEVFLSMQEVDPSVALILSSGYDMHDSLEALVGSPPPRFLMKPYRSPELLRVIRETIRQSQDLRQS